MLREASGEEVLGGLGQSYEAETDITFSYRQSLFGAFFARKELNEENALLRYEDVSQYNTILWYPTVLEEKLITSVKQGDTPAIRALFSQIREENLKKRHLSDSAVRLLTSNLMSTLLKANSYVSMDEKMSRIIQNVNKITDLSEALNLLQSYYEEMSEEINRSKNDMDEAFRAEIMTYMLENYSDPQMSIGNAAAHFHLSESYFSTFFKKLTGETFSGCLERLRVERSRQLLKETDYSVDQIAQMVGYSNGGTFRRAFRRLTGMSPTEWRK
ncbi:MAG: AraC family transcriptional regulator [Lachnospiraceae bacterium]|nr:AraC family transcriptional regulator [Lachnospiraceae bacterium]